MKNSDKLFGLASILGLLVSIFSLGYYSFDYLVPYSILKYFLIGTLGSISGAIIPLYILRFVAKTKAPSVFISHHYSNNDIAKKIANELRKVSSHVWLDEYEITIGDNIKNKIESGLKDSDYFLIILSEDGNKSNWSEVELSNALKLGKIILPVKIDNSDPPEAIKDIAYVDISNSFEVGINRIKKVFISNVYDSKNSANQNT